MCLAIPGKLVDESQDQGLRFGRVDFGGVRKAICLEYVPEAEVGDYVLVHVGFAISVVSEEEAQETFRLLEEIDALGELTDCDPATPPAREAEAPP